MFLWRRHYALMDVIRSIAQLSLDVNVMKSRVHVVVVVAVVESAKQEVEIEPT